MSQDPSTPKEPRSAEPRPAGGAGGLRAPGHSAADGGAGGLRMPGRAAADGGAQGPRVPGRSGVNGDASSLTRSGRAAESSAQASKESGGTSAQAGAAAGQAARETQDVRGAQSAQAGQGPQSPDATTDPGSPLGRSKAHDEHDKHKVGERDANREDDPANASGKGDAPRGPLGKAASKHHGRSAKGRRGGGANGLGGPSAREAQDKDDSKKLKAAAGAGATAAAAPVVGAGLALVMLMNFLRRALAMLEALARNLIRTIIAVAKAAAHAVGHAMMTGITAMGHAVVAATGGLISGTAAAVTGAVTAGAVLVGSVVGVGGAINASNDARKLDGGTTQSCAVDVQEAISKNDTPVDTSAQADANAQQVWGALKGIGMPDNNIAGILGNWSIESGVDPTSVEGVFNEPYRVGPAKKSKIDGGGTMGIGLGQWTAERHTMLMNYASEKKTDWSSLKLQLEFMVTKDSGASIIQDMVANDKGSAEKATDFYLEKWERPLNPGATESAREQAAAGWLAKGASWGANDDLKDSVISAAAGAQDSANSGAIGSAADSCKSDGGGGSYDNSSIVTTALSYAYPHTGDGRGNNGTPLYQELNNYYLGNNVYMDCGEVVATAVRASNTDKDFPSISTATMITYLPTSPYWEEIKWGNDQSKLKPGDVMIRNDGSGIHHVLLYVGEQNIINAFDGKADPGTSIVEGSQDEWSAQVSKLSSWYNGFRVFRNTKKNPYPASDPKASYKPKASSNAWKNGKVAVMEDSASSSSKDSSGTHPNQG